MVQLSSRLDAGFLLTNFSEDRDPAPFVHDPAIPMEKSNDTRETLGKNTQRIASAFEAIIRQHPEQWFNYVPIWKPNS